MPGGRFGVRATFNSDQELVAHNARFAEMLVTALFDEGLR